MLVPRFEIVKELAVTRRNFARILSVEKNEFPISGGSEAVSASDPRTGKNCEIIALYSIFSAKDEKRNRDGLKSFELFANRSRLRRRFENEPRFHFDAKTSGGA